jgi:hypothetical protein
MLNYSTVTVDVGTVITFVRTETIDTTDIIEDFILYHHTNFYLKV